MTERIYPMQFISGFIGELNTVQTSLLYYILLFLAVHTVCFVIYLKAPFLWSKIFVMTQRTSLVNFFLITILLSVLSTGLFHAPVHEEFASYLDIAGYFILTFIALYAAPRITVWFVA